MPNQHILFGFGIPDEKLIPQTCDPKVANSITSAGTPVGAKFMMRMLEREGFTRDITLGDGRVILDSRCHDTMRRIEKMDIELVPVEQDACYDFYHRGLDCSDADTRREDNPVKEVPEEPPPIVTGSDK